MLKRIKMLRMTKSGRNLAFKDKYTGKVMSSAKFVCEIQKGNYPKYNIRVINKISTSVLRLDNSINNNL